jgi:hypothetical protein
MVSVLTLAPLPAVVWSALLSDIVGSSGTGAFIGHLTVIEVAEVKCLAPAMRALWTARALLITGQRRATTCKLEIVPPPGLEPGCGVVDNVRIVADEVRLRKGHMARD